MMIWKVTIKPTDPNEDEFCIFVTSNRMSTAIRIADSCIVDAGAGEIVEVRGSSTEEAEAYRA